MVGMGILQPVVALAAWTMVMWLWMYATRIPAMREARVDPDRIVPAEVYDVVAAQVSIERAALVGLVPRRVLERTDPARWAQLDLGPETTIEARLAARR